MKLPIETKPALWGIAGGAIAMAVIGFTWGGWVTASRAESDAKVRTSTAVVSALAPFCVEKFQHSAASEANLAELKKADMWSRGDFVEKGGWATLPGQETPDQVTAIARACAVMLAGA